MIPFPNGKEEEESNKISVLKPALRFTKKEIETMSEDSKKFITIKIEVPVREKPSGVLEARYRAHGLNLYAASVDYDKLRAKFLDVLRNFVMQPKRDAEQEPPQEPPKRSPAFSQVCEDWLELKRPLIKQPTYNYYVQLFGANILPSFYGRCVDEVKQSDVQKLINDYVEQEKYRTATKIYQTLKAVFDYAVCEELLERSPMRKLRPPKYEEQNGIALTLDEEREFVALVNSSKCIQEIKAALLFLLYTGVRRSELATARIEGDIVSVVCSKVRKGFKERRRLIPITPMLSRWLLRIELDKLRDIRPDALTQAMKRLMPAHHLHELRHTYITRCQECGVPREVVSVWAGHAADNTQTSNVYTHFSAEFMKAQAQKVDYNI